MENQTSTSAQSTTELFSLVGVAIGLTAYAWDLSFNYGTFGVIFLGHSIAIWLFSISILTISLLGKGKLLPGKKLLGYFLLVLPSVWLITRILDDPTTTGQVTDQVLSVVSLASILISLPYVVYLFFYFTNPSVLQLQKKLMTGLALLVLFVGLVGFGLGKNNYLIMTCQNFEVSGQDTPANCVKAK